MLKKQDSKILITQAFIYTLITIGLGLIIILLSLNRFEVAIVLDLQGFLRGTIGIQLFSLITYIGDFYVLDGINNHLLNIFIHKIKEKKTSSTRTGNLFGANNPYDVFFPKCYEPSKAIPIFLRCNSICF